MHEIFNGFMSFDAKFWRTIIPLLISPGKVTREYVNGKRNKYSNPFRFYFTVSILFFLVVGLSISKNKFEKLTQESSTTATEKITEEVKPKQKISTTRQIDSLKNEVERQMNASSIPIPKNIQKKVLKDVEKEAKDTTAIKISPGSRISFNGKSKVDRLISYQKKHPDATIDEALDSLKYDKNFINRFLYTRAKTVNSFMTDEESREKFLSDLLSYGSVSLFIFLPFFTLFLGLFYIRRSFTYLDHLIFVFHTQTVFFMLMTVFYLISFFIDMDKEWIFFALFLLYLFLAMKKFYQQGYFKTLIKFLMLNLVYTIFGVIGILIVALISFALY